MNPNFPGITINPIEKQFLERARLGIMRTSGTAALPGWMTANLRHPRNSQLPWSFTDHEYQMAILADAAPHVVTKKCAQVGLSELSARMALGLATLLSGTHWLYSLPSTSFARKFMSTRIDPAIAASDLLKRMKNRDIDSTELKQIGDSFLYLVGAQRMSQAISIPCRGLIRDEMDFCSETVLTSFLSRLGHNEPGEEILRDFSTPTVPGYGIDKEFKAGTQHVYMVWHERCGKWVEVDPILDIVLPGFDDLLVNLAKSDLDDPRVLPGKAWVKCRCCGNEVSQQNLMTPEYRAWVPRYPDREVHSYYVSPLDVPKVNPVKKIITKIKGYNRQDDWVNFGLGHAHLSSGTAVNPGVLTASCVGEVVPPRDHAMTGTVIGVDVGKVSHLVVLAHRQNKWVVLHMERITQKISADGTDNLSETIIRRGRQYGATKIVIDAMPDITVPKMVIEKSYWQQCYASYFVKTIKDLKDYKEDDVLGTVNVARTPMIDALVKDINGGIFVFPSERATPEIEIMQAHLRKLRRVRRISEATGEESSAWVSTDDEDHYAFALVYAYTAAKMADTGVAGTTNGVTAGMLAGKVKMKQFGDPAKGTPAQHAAGIFGASR